MTLSALILSLALKTQARDRPTVQYYQQTFQISARGDKSSVPLAPEETPNSKSLEFRKNDSFAVWDDRGLTVRRGEQSSSSHLPEIAVSPRAFPREEILKTIDRIKSGEVTKDAAGLSGARRIGKDVYFLVRWEDKTGKPWAEALVQVDLSADKLAPHLLGRFGGLSSATKSIDDKLLIADGKLAIVEHSRNTWGLSTYDPATKQFSTQEMGATLVSVESLGSSQALFVETSVYGSTIAGRVDMVTGTRKILYEGREHARFLDSEAPEIVLAGSGEKNKLIDCVTGAVRAIPYKIDARRVGKDILLWSDPASPTRVWLMSPASWTTLATWRAD
jgi:hypothetical protein